jgi:hypothetical protein
MDYYEQRSATEFWAKFTDENGERMSFTAISQVLRNEREEKEKELANEARQVYSHERFQELFSYRKSGRKFVKTKDAEIAKTYERLCQQGITE